jgi:hypothetical protein
MTAWDDPELLALMDQADERLSPGDFTDALTAAMAQGEAAGKLVLDGPATKAGGVTARSSDVVPLFKAELRRRLMTH